MPAVSEPGPGGPALPRTWRPLGVRLAALIFGGGLLVVCVAAWVGFDDETRGAFSGAEKGTLLALGLMVGAVLLGVSRSRVVADARGIEVVNGFRKRAFAREEIVAVTLPRGAPWATLDLSDGTSVAAMGIQGSDGARALTAVRELRNLLDS